MQDFFQAISFFYFYIADSLVGKTCEFQLFLQ